MSLLFRALHAHTADERDALHLLTLALSCFSDLLSVYGVHHLHVDLQLVEGEQHSLTPVGPPPQVHQVNLKWV